MKKLFKFINKHKLETLIFILGFIFSSWLMFSTFSYSNGQMQLASKVWSDFASHIPLIRSFSYGTNFPTEYPLFSGPPIKYHFLFYAFVGLLENLGFQIDYALNVPSIIGFSFLILMIYLLAKLIFKSRIVGLLSIVFFLFNGSLEFIDFFNKNSVSLTSFLKIFTNNQFLAFGPYNQSIISAFWNLNIYTNQRHLALSFALVLFIFYYLIKNKDRKINLSRHILLGVLLGLSFLLNMAVYLMGLIVLCGFFFSFKNKKTAILLTILTAIILGFPQYLFISSYPSSFKISLHLGYLVENLNIITFFKYWIQNLGFHFFLILISFFIVNKFQKKLLLSFFFLFIVGNLIQFSPEIAANHKFFNLFLILGGMYSSFVVYKLWRKNKLFKSLGVILFVVLIFSGILDFFPIFNDHKILLDDISTNKEARWIYYNTSKNAIFLNSDYLYDNASIAGRKIFLGWPYFAWSQGYDTLARDNLRKDMLNTNDINFFCKEAKIHNLTYAEINTLNTEIPINKNFFENNFKKIYSNQQNNYIIYELSEKCNL